VKEAVKGISFEIEEGEIVGFLVPNGAGKTTTLKMLSGILHPTSGEASVMGYTPWERKKSFKKNISIVMGQKNQLWWDLPANESLYLNKCIYEIDDRLYYETLEELTSILDVKEQLKVQLRRLSLGERMKMELIAALIHRPKVILLDEPTIGLDLVSQKSVREFLAAYNKDTKTTILLTSHYMKDIQDLCKRTIVINHGTIVFDGPLSGINDSLGRYKLIKLRMDEPVDQERLLQFGRIKNHDGMEATLEIEADSIKSVTRQLLDHLPVIDITIEEYPIEEGIAQLYRRMDEP